MSRLATLLAVTAIALITPSMAAAQAPVSCEGAQVRTLAVDARNDEWVTAQVKVQPGDLVIVQASGEAVLGAWFGKVGPSGHPNGLGRLDMKIGTGTVTHVGVRWVGEVDVSGPVKFRINETDRNDNQGGYTVHVIVLPKGSLPAPKVVEPD